MLSRRFFRAQALALCALGFAFFLSPASASATEYSLTGPLDFVRERGHPQREVINFQAPAPGKYYLLRIHNGPGELRPVDAGWITVNGRNTLNLASLQWRKSNRKKDFDCPFWKSHCGDWQGDQSEPVEVPLTLELANELAVQLHGRPGTGLRLEVLSVGDENPYFNEFPLSGPHTLNPVFGWPQEQEIALNAPEAGTHYLLRLRNGAGELMPVSAGWLWLNGRELLGPKDIARNKTFCRKGHSRGKTKGQNKHAPWRADFGQPCDQDPEIQLPLTLALENTLTVKLHGHWHSGVEVEIVGVDNDLPLISAAVDPAANEAGWHNVDATVSFTCSDGLSGIESCSDPVLVSEEGAAQANTGTAVDKAGNTAETQLSVSLDKTAPLLTAEITPPANDAGWHRETATITYQCEDTLSGVANCPEQQQVSEEGADQQVSASATDIAGNSTQIQNTVSLDLTPPEIVTAINPSANGAGWHKSPVALSYQCSDNLSGVADCPEERIESLQGLKREIVVTATDIAGNSADSSAQLNIDTTPPAIRPQLSAPANPAGWHRVPVTVSYLCSDNLSGIAGCPQSQTLAGDGAGQAVSGSALDLAGNSASAGVTVNLDQTPPQLTAEIAPPANSAGWHRETATISYQCEDALSGVANCPEQQQLREEGAGQQITATAEDMAGNSTQLQNTLNLDLTPPEIATDINPPANAAGWHNATVTLSYQCSDDLSGVAECPADHTESQEGRDQEIPVTATDIAGNSADSSAQLNIDTTAPAIQAQLSTPANAAGWHNAPVTVSYQCEDGLSGVASCPESQTLAGDGADQISSGSALDLAGNSASAGVTVNLDQTPPLLIAEIAPPANDAGWHREIVTISYQCDDALSGVADCPEARVESTEGRNREIAVTATDIAGNIAGSSAQLSIDTTPPAIQPELSAPANAAGWHNAQVTVSYQCSDNLSGIATCPEPQTLAGDGADQTVNGSALDLAGNSASAGITVNLDQTPPEISFVSPANGSLLREPQPELQLLLSDNLALDADSLEVIAAGSAVTGCVISGNRANCALPQPLPADAAIALSASVRDLAGNTGEAGITTAIDSDGDAVADYADQCADTSGTQTANADGCSLEQLDSDNDGVNDAEEIAAGSDPRDGNSFPPLLIETFAASPSTIGSKGQRVELRWQVKGAREIAVSSDGGEATAEALASEGALAVNPQITTNYTLTATGPGGETSQSLTVKLDLPPPPELWTAPSIPVQEQIATSLAVAEDGSAYVGAFDGNFYKVDPSGQVAWTLENAGLVMGKAAIAGERIIVGANVSGSGRLESEGRVYALDSDKTPLWDFDTEGAVVAGPILSPDKTTAYIATHTGHLYALNSETGEQLWHYQLPDDQKITAAPAVTQQKLIVHTEGKQIFALDASASPPGERILWSRNLE